MYSSSRIAPLVAHPIAQQLIEDLSPPPPHQDPAGIEATGTAIARSIHQHQTAHIGGMTQSGTQPNQRAGYYGIHPPSFANTVECAKQLAPFASVHLPLGRRRPAQACRHAKDRYHRQTEERSQPPRHTHPKESQAPNTSGRRRDVSSRAHRRCHRRQRRHSPRGPTFAIPARDAWPVPTRTGSALRPHPRHHRQY